MIWLLFNNKKSNPVVTELFIRVRKLNISLAFITQSHFAVARDVRLNSSNYFIMKIPNKLKLQKAATNCSSDIDFKEFMNLYKIRTATLYIFSHWCYSCIR